MRPLLDFWHTELSDNKFVLFSEIVYGHLSVIAVKKIVTIDLLSIMWEISIYLWNEWVNEFIIQLYRIYQYYKSQYKF